VLEGARSEVAHSRKVYDSCDMSRLGTGQRLASGLRIAP
jgi:hypothetical protein